MDLEQRKSSGLVRRNLNKCLREWYIGQLTEIEREYINEGHGVDSGSVCCYDALRRPHLLL